MSSPGTARRDVISVRPRVSLIARNRAAALRDERLAAMFPVARQIVEASAHGDRARLLLRISDEVLLEYFAALTDACKETGFDDGAHYLLERYGALLAVRDELGLLRDGDRLELFRRGLAALAHGASSS